MPIPVINIAAMREWEQATWAGGQTEANVIRRVGQCLASHARNLTRDGDHILILAGKGNNGADARAAGEFLEARTVKVLDLHNPENDLATLATALQGKPALIIDGLFGIGLNRPLDEHWQKIIGAVNATKIAVLAVDVPSGMNADTGEAFGAVIEAAVTLAIGAPKTGMLAPPAWQPVGRLEVAHDVGLIPCPAKSELVWIMPADFHNFPPRRAAYGHKGSFGHVAIVAGSLGFHGAAVLTVRGAQRAQPGKATLFTQENIYLAVASQLQSAMVSFWNRETKLPEGMSGLLAGPGLVAREATEHLRQAMNLWWRDLDFPVVVDASALDYVAAGPYTRKPGRVLTPHPGEAGRLLNWPTQRVQANRVVALREISKKFSNCWVVLKGHQTLIGRNEGEIFVNSSGNPHLAQGGSGDLLSGYLAGLLAQPPLQAHVGQTILYAVWQHGATADKLQATRPNWTVEDLANELGNVR